MNSAIRAIVKKNIGLYSLLNSLHNRRNLAFYRRLCRSRHFDEIWKGFQGSCSGKRCFIIGNGPSLRPSDLDTIINEDCFASNQIFRIFDKTNWRPTYYAVQDIYGNIADVVDSLPCEHVFVGDYYWRTIGTSNPRALCYHAERVVSGDVTFSTDVPAQGVVDSFTVTYALIQFAAYMGYSKMYLLGVDHSYKNTIGIDGRVKKNEDAGNHFYGDSSSSPVLANLEAMEKAYRAALRQSQLGGFEILNATRGGCLEVFQRVDFDDLFSGNE